MNVASSPEALGRARKTQGKRTLAKVLRERGVLSTAHAVDVALDVCDALATAHANGVVHGQLGLSCVRLLFTPELGPRELEIFTLASDEDSGVAGVVAPFQGPEQRQGRASDARADVWALGALLYTMLVGTPPPAGDVVAPADSMPMSLAAVVEACLCSDPTSRPHSVDQIAEKIASFASSPPDRFVALAERRERRERAERVRRSLELRGLSEMPNVLDKLDEAALARAQRETAVITTLPVGSTTEAALERLMTAVHEGTDAARVELATGLPALIDFDDDDDAQVTIVQEETVPLVPIASPLANAHVVLPEPPPPSAPLLATPPARPGPSRALVVAASSLAAVVLCSSLAYIGYALTSPPAPAPTSVTPATATATATAAATAPATATAATEPVIPVFVPSALPDSPPVTPDSLPSAR